MTSSALVGYFRRVVYGTLKYSHFTVPDPCLSNPCDPNAYCEREGLLSENFTCSCQAPFIVGNGFNCSGIAIYIS